MRGPVALLAVLIALLVSAGAARASTVVYQCGPGVCAVDPAAASPQPRQLAADARLAGMTRDGTTIAWVDAAGNLVKVPLAGGAPQTVYTGAVGNQPVMSPDGGQFLWWQTGPGPILGSIDVYVYRLVVGQSEPEGVSNCYQCTTTHGWLGATAIAAFPGDSDDGDPPSDICALAPGSGSDCATRIAADARGQLAWPTGSPDGSLVAASLHLPSTGDSDFDGGLSLYSVATGGVARDVTPGPGDLEPQFSPDGGSLVFARGDQIVTRDLSSGAEKVLATGTYPFWGAAGGSTPPVSGGGARAVTGLSVTRARLRSGRLAVTATLTPAAAGQSLTVTVRAGRAHASLHRTATRGRLAFTARLGRALRRARSATVTVAYAGGASQAPASVSLLASRTDAGLRITRLRRRGARLELAGHIAHRARGTLTVALVAADGTAHTLHPRIRSGGSWGLRAASAGATQLRVGYRGDRRRQLSGAQLVRRVAAG